MSAKPASWQNREFAFRKYVNAFFKEHYTGLSSGTTSTVISGFTPLYNRIGTL